MKYLKFLVLLLILCNLPGYASMHHNPVLGAMLSYCTFFAIIAYYFLNRKEKPVIHFLIFGTLFFTISLIVNAQFSTLLLITFARYFIFMITISTVLRDLKSEEIYSVMLIGSLSIIFEAIFINGIGSKSTGFYMNASFAAFVCVFGYALGLTLKNKNLKNIGQIVFTVAGLLTYSITFLLIWGLIHLLSLFTDARNIYKLAVCVALFAVFISFSDKVQLNKQLIPAASTLSEMNMDRKLGENDPNENWVLNFEKILENPIWGKGYGKTSANEDIRFTVQVGVHNTFSMIMAEAGVFALIYFLWIYGNLLVNGLYFFKQKPAIFLISFALMLYMLTSYQYFESYLVLFTSLWLYHEIYKMKKINWPKARMIIRSTEKVKERGEEYLLKQYHLN